MAHGINHAKKIVIGQADHLAEQLQNGAGADPATQGKAIGLVIQMIKPLYEADFVTVQACAETRSVCSEHQTLHHEAIIAKIEEVAAQLPEKEAIQPSNSLQGPKATKGMSMRLGPLELKGAVVPIAVVLAVLLVPTASVLFILGKESGWW